MSTRCSVLRIKLHVALLTFHVTMEVIYYMHVSHYSHSVRNLSKGCKQIGANHASVCVFIHNLPDINI